jgi:hypothetical protein
MKWLHLTETIGEAESLVQLIKADNSQSIINLLNQKNVEERVEILSAVLDDILDQIMMGDIENPLTYLDTIDDVLVIIFKPLDHQFKEYNLDLCQKYVHLTK